ncbi:polyphosphate kinase 1 [Olivibacter sp. SDN3]|uniref:polyphosphate kinase 1 n=1 Tax=Olivibacter sp. SDN3 TaxID=2764720 RepID=UPI0016519B15|nr:polyphosphate kinase 1 [Olivibacter sp. SDN3]QNL50502.1 polyphosphate kinase 1 [Olivibacter sp. SDN3]
MKNRFFSRDLSWLTFNDRILDEATYARTPLKEKMKFLAIYSSNLDEFYRVRIPVLMALKKINKNEAIAENIIKKGEFKAVKQTIVQQQERFGQILSSQILPLLHKEDVHLVYNEPIPLTILEKTRYYFFCTLAGYLEIIYPKKQRFFPRNNQLYLAIFFTDQSDEQLALVNIPSNIVSRFLKVDFNGTSYILFIDDIIKQYLQVFFPEKEIIGVYSFKVTRDAELDLQDEYEGDIAEKIEQQLNQRDFGLATRLLYQPDLPETYLAALVQVFTLKKANKVAGGYYHNLKDFFDFPIYNSAWEYKAAPPIVSCLKNEAASVFDSLDRRDLLINTPYESYDTVLRFFNEAAIDPYVEDIYTTMYRVAPESRIARALISAAKNAKKVTVFVELKARFDESNNIKWAKQMKEAGVQIIFSIPKLKVHAKTTLVKRRISDKVQHYGLFATGNLNENTAKTYTDHILLTAGREMTADLQKLFLFLAERKHPATGDYILFKQLLVAQFNLLPSFINLIDREIEHAQQGKKASIILKMNNLEEQRLIDKLYEASEKGVQITLIIRGICRLRPGLAKANTPINVIRIVGRYLEHGRVFIFDNNDNPKIYLGSSDWMNRNIYRRIEVCFPIHDVELKNRLCKIIQLQLQDDVAAVNLDHCLNNVEKPSKNGIHAQEDIYRYLKTSVHPINL